MTLPERTFIFDASTRLQDKERAGHTKPNNLLTKKNDISQWLHYVLGAFAVILAGKISRMIDKKIPKTPNWHKQHSSNASQDAGMRRAKAGPDYNGGNNGNGGFKQGGARAGSFPGATGGSGKLSSIPDHVKSHLKVLRLPLTQVTEQQVKEAYRRAVMLHHPDRVAGVVQSEPSGSVVGAQKGASPQVHASPTPSASPGSPVEDAAIGGTVSAYEKSVHDIKLEQEIKQRKKVSEIKFKQVNEAYQFLIEHFASKS